MQKKLLALTMLGAFVSVAQAQSNVTIYGIVDAALEYGKFNKGVSMTRLQSGDLQASRFGFRGTEDLGGGMKANFGMEMGFSADTGVVSTDGTLWTRGSAVGLEGSFGRVDLGKQYVPMFWVYLGSDPSTYGLTNSSVLDNLQHTAVLGKTGTGGFYNNVLRYRIPKINGFDGEISYSLGNELSGDRKNDGRNIGMNLQYTNGPLWAGYAYNQFTTRGAADVADANQKTHMVGGSYDFTKIKIGVNYLRTTDMTTTKGDANSWQISGKIPVSSGDINVGTARLTEAGKAAQAYHLGYVHFLSKRTQLYSYVSRMQNNSSGTRGLALLNGAFGTVDPGFNATAVTFGVRHGF